MKSFSHRSPYGGQVFAALTSPSRRSHPLTYLQIGEKGSSTGSPENQLRELRGWVINYEREAPHTILTFA